MLEQDNFRRSEQFQLLQSVCRCVTEGAVVTVAWPCLLNNRLFGVAGLELHMNDILENVTYYQEDSSHAFIMDKRGLKFDYYSG